MAKGQKFGDAVGAGGLLGGELLCSLRKLRFRNRVDRKLVLQTFCVAI